MTERRGAHHELAFGLHAVSRLLARAPERVRGITTLTGRSDRRLLELLARADELGLPVERVSRSALDRLAGGGAHQGIVASFHAREPLPEGALVELLGGAAGDPLLLILDGVQDPHNLGACLRTADATGVTAVVVPRDRAVGLNATVRKVACGAAETVPLVQVTNLARTLRSLKEQGVWLVGTADEAEESIFEADLGGPLALVLGSEGRGLRRLTREHCDRLVALPMRGEVESLNVSVAAGVCLYFALARRESA
jgi:23S rRNA (guanosine2251-2'-O)-methyltransferase